MASKVAKAKELRGWDLVREIIKEKAIHEADICNLQNAIAGVPIGEVQAFEEALDTNERQTFIWIVARVLSPENTVHILRWTVIERYAEKIRQETEEADAEEWRQIGAARVKINRAKYATRRIFKGLRARISETERKLRWANNLLEQQRQKNHELVTAIEQLRDELEAAQEQAHRADDIIQAVQLIKSL